MEQGVGVLYACNLGPPSWLTCSEVDEEEERFEELINLSTVKLEFFEIPYDVPCAVQRTEAISQPLRSNDSLQEPCIA